jgi:hypothetical protein
MKHLTPINVILAIVVMALLLRGRPEPSPEVTRSDELRSAALVEDLKSKGFDVIPAQEHRDLLTSLQRAEDSVDILSVARADLARRVEIMDGRVRSAVNATVEARAALELVGHVDTVLVDVPTTVAVGGVHWSYDDSTFAVEADYHPPGGLSLDLAARPRLLLAWVETPDGKLIATATTTDDRVKLQLSEAVYQLPAAQPGCGLRCKAKIALYTAAAVIATQEGVRLLRGR